MRAHGIRFADRTSMQTNTTHHFNNLIGPVGFKRTGLESTGVAEELVP